MIGLALNLMVQLVVITVQVAFMTIRLAATVAVMCARWAARV